MNKVYNYETISLGEVEELEKNNYFLECDGDKKSLIIYSNDFQPKDKDIDTDNEMTH